MDQRLSPEVEREIGDRERKFDLAKRRVEALELGLKGNEKLLEVRHFNRERIEMQIRRVERDLAQARKDLADAEAKLAEAWSWRNPASAVSGDQE
jgi:septal ring factor EnvC (AmiA/AmiB activator)